MTEQVHWLDAAKRRYDDQHADARDTVKRRLFGEPKEQPATDPDEGPDAA